MKRGAAPTSSSATAGRISEHHWASVHNEGTVAGLPRPLSALSMILRLLYRKLPSDITSFGVFFFFCYAVLLGINNNPIDVHSAILFPQNVTCITALLKNHVELITMIILTIHISKLRHREGVWLVQGHITNKVWNLHTH